MNSTSETTFAQRVRRPLRLFYALGLCLALLSGSLALRDFPASAQSNVLLRVDLSVDSYDITSFGRVLDLNLRYRTGDPLTETCSDVDPQNVVLTLTLPAGVTFLAETKGSGVYDPAANSVTWNLGTLDRLFNCYSGTMIRGTVEVDQAVPDGTMLTASADISTSTPGDDPSDNKAAVDFQGGMLPLDVVFEGAHASCRAVDVSDTRYDGQSLSCVDSDSGVFPYGISATASVFVADMGSPLPRSLGELTVSLRRWIEVPRLAIKGSARAGYDYDPSGASLELPASADAGLTQDLAVHNPNPFEVALRVLYDSYGHAGCSSNASGHPGDSYVEDSVPSVDCGYSDDRNASGTLHLDCDGTSNSCEQVIHTPDGTTEDVVFSEMARVPASGTRDIRSIFDADAGAGTSITYLGTQTLVKVGSASFNGVGQVQIALAGTVLGRRANALRITAASPVDLLLTDPAGNRAGRGVDEEPTDVGEGNEVLISPAFLNEIPGTQYSGPEVEPETLTVGLPEPGMYQLDVMGTGDGPYTLTFEALDETDQVISQQTITGEATDGSSFSQEFMLDDSGKIRFNNGGVYLPVVIR